MECPNCNTEISTMKLEYLRAGSTEICNSCKYELEFNDKGQLEASNTSLVTNTVGTSDDSMDNGINSSNHDIMSHGANSPESPEEDSDSEDEDEDFDDDYDDDDDDEEDFDDEEDSEEEEHVTAFIN